MSILNERIAMPDLSGLPDWQVAEVLNTRDEANGMAWVDVASAQVRAILMASFDWPKVLSAANGAAGQVRDVCVIMRDALTLHQTVSFGDEGLREAMIAGLTLAVANNVVSQGAYQSILSIAQRPMSWAEANDVEVTPRAVALARGAS